MAHLPLFDAARQATIRTPLWDHQRRAVAFATPKRGAMLAVRMGGGKTLTTISLLHAWDARCVLVLSPLSVVSTWPREFETHSGESWNFAELSSGTVGKRTDQAIQAVERALVLKQRCAVVINHESAWREPFKKFALTTRWDAIIVDECHRSKSPGGRFSMFLAQLRSYQPSAHRLGLSGSPMPHSPLDLYAQMRFIDPDIFGTSFQRFKMRYAIMGGFEGRQAIGFRDEAEMMERFARAAFIAQEKDLLDLPPETDAVRSVALEPEAKQLYKRLEDDFYAEVEDGAISASNALVKLLRLQQVCSGTTKLDSGEEKVVSEAKRDALADLLADVEPGRKVVVFGRFRCDLESARHAADAAGLRYGEVSGSRKDLDAGRFPPEVDLLGVQIQAGGVGIDLSRASLGVFLSTGFSLGDYLQARARLHRPGQKNPVTFVHLLADQSIDWQVFKTLARREQIIATLLKRGTHE